MTLVSSNKSNLPLQLDQLTKLVDSNNHVLAFKLSFRNYYKHSYNRPTFSLTITPQSKFCPVNTVLEYLEIRGHQPGPLFLTTGGQAVSRKLFVNCLSRASIHCKLDPSTIMDKFLWDTCVYLSLLHILRTSDAFPLSPFNVGLKLVHIQPCTLFPLHFYQATVNGGERGLQKNPEYVIQSDLKDKTPYSPNEFVHDCRYKGHSFRIGAASHAGLH